MVIHKKFETVQEKCAGKVQAILLGSTEAQAVFMADMVEAMARNIELVVTQEKAGCWSLPKGISRD